MVIKSTLVGFNPGDIKYPNLPLMTTDNVQLGFNETKTGNELQLIIGIRYWASDNFSDQIFDITQAIATYKIETDGMLSMNDLNSLCKNAVGLLANYINTIGKTKGIPPKSIPPLPLDKVQAALQPIVDLFLSAAN